MDIQGGASGNAKVYITASEAPVACKRRVTCSLGLRLQIAVGDGPGAQEETNQIHTLALDTLFYFSISWLPRAGGVWMGLSKARATEFKWNCRALRLPDLYVV